MDGNNFGNGNPQNNNNGNSQFDIQNSSNYQDNTANSSNYQAPPQTGPDDNKASGKQIAGLVLGILAILFSCCYGIPGLIFGIAGLILSIMGNKESKSGVGIAGLVCSIIGLLAGVAMTIYFGYIFALVFEMMENGELDSYMEMMDYMKYR